LWEKKKNRNCVYVSLSRIVQKYRLKLRKHKKLPIVKISYGTTPRLHLRGNEIDN